MGIVVMFMALASLTPFLFVQLNKKIIAAVQTVMLIGMWIYFFQALFHTAPHAFSITWIMFYASLLIAEFAWIMFIGFLIKEYEAAKKTTTTY
ncbi:hypothetical protein ACFSMW_08340 [Virgibacillus halophilus]|uniref:hypothetical protein n=1 Tax=Tigheibacillus halophilus TaxID=361280 RepID=UPI00363A44F1